MINEIELRKWDIFVEQNRINIEKRLEELKKGAEDEKEN